MKYKKVIKKIAKAHNTTKEEIDYEIKAALKIAGINVSPDIIVEIIAEKIKKTIYRKTV